METLTFDEAAHEYRHAGQRVPNVTRILSCLTDYSRVPIDVLAAKADLGRRVHQACEYHDDNDLDDESVAPDVMPYLQGYRRFLQEARPRIELNERRVWNPVFRYAGTLDRVLLIDGVRWLVDLKTCFRTPASAGPQTAAYMAALPHGHQVKRRAALRLLPDATYRLEPLEQPDDWAIFLACLTVHNYQESKNS